MLEKLEDVTQLSARVVRILGQNGSPFTLQGTNCYLLGTGPKRVLVDTGSGLRSFLVLLKEQLQDHELDAIIITHHHIDHIGGVKSILKGISNNNSDVTIYMKDVGPVWREHRKNVQYCSLHDGQVIRCGGVALEVWMSPGHTSDSICLWMPEERALFSGDSVLGEGKSPVLEDLHAYFRSMHTLLAKLESYEQPVVIYPGHGQVIRDGVAALKLAITKREARNAEIVQLLRKKSSSGSGLTVEQITNEVYRKVPPELRIAAIGTVKRHLTYLERMQVVKRRLSEENIGIYELLDLTNSL